MSRGCHEVVANLIRYRNMSINKEKNKVFNYAHTCVCETPVGFRFRSMVPGLRRLGGEGQRKSARGQGDRATLQHPVRLAKGQKEHRARDPRPTPPTAGQNQQTQPSHTRTCEPQDRQYRHNITNSCNGSANRPKIDLPISRKNRNFANNNNNQQ